MKLRTSINFVVFVALAFLPGNALAADSTKIWSLEDCMAYAVRNNFEVQQQVINQDDYRRDHTRQVLSHLPNLSAATGAGLNFGRGIDPETNAYVMNSSLGNNYSLGTGVILFNGFAKINQTRATKIAKLSGAHAQQQTEDQVALLTMAAFIELVHNKELMNLLAQQVEEKREMLRQVKRENDLGTKSYADLVQLEADVAGAEYNLIAGESALKNSLIGLKDRMNYPLEKDLDIEPDIKLVELYDSGQSLGDLLEYATSTLPGMRIAENRLKISELQYKAQKASLYPSISLSAGVGTSYNTMLGGAGNRNPIPYFRVLDNNLGEYININMGIPIFDGLYRRIAADKAYNEVKRRHINLEQADRELRSEIEQAVLDMNSAGQRYIQAGKQVAANEIAYNVTKRKFEEGLLTALDLQTSSNNLMSSRIDLLNSRLTYIAKRREVNYYKGIPLVTPQD